MLINKAIGERMTELAKERDRSVSYLARKGGLRESTATEIVRGDSKNPRITSIMRFCEGCNITLEEFFASPLFEATEEEKEE